MKKRVGIDLTSNINNEVLTKKIEDLTLHELANEHPKMTEVEYQRLCESIEEIGQLEPILIYKNKIVDGRHRFWAIESLGLDYTGSRDSIQYAYRHCSRNCFRF
ncbi:MAG: ParB N-terminal domain-containing protein [Sulfurovum sp.]|nr:ParB N-terminal domain-containing protein [Sulfurovum sp.]